MTIQQILGNSTEGNAINLTPKIPIFFVAKLYVIEWNLAKIGIWTCVHFRMSPFSNLSYGVFSSVDLFLRRRSPMNTTGSVAGNPKFHHIKTATLTFAESFTLKMFSLHSWNSLTWKSVLHAEERTSRKKKVNAFNATTHTRHRLRLRRWRSIRWHPLWSLRVRSRR